MPKFDYTNQNSKTNKYNVIVGTIDGRVNLSNFNYNYGKWTRDNMITFPAHFNDEKNDSGTITLRKMYCINGIGFSSKYKNFLYTAGSDGSIIFWNFQTKEKIKKLNFG